MLIHDALPTPLTCVLGVAAFALIVAAEVAYGRLKRLPGVSAASAEGIGALTRELLSVRSQSLTWRRGEVLAAVIAVGALLAIFTHIPGTN